MYSYIIRYMFMYIYMYIGKRKGGSEADESDAESVDSLPGECDITAFLNGNDVTKVLHIHATANKDDDGAFEH